SYTIEFNLLKNFYANHWMILLIKGCFYRVIYCIFVIDGIG
ncbi:MAG: hypothetical protein UZ05_CHB002002404, partial [Chlorobi bacterium OLB5]